jgi:hypothetical protein
MWPKGVEVRHVSIGGKTPRRTSGQLTSDGIGEVITIEGVENLYVEAEKFQPDFFFFGIHHGFSRENLVRVRHKSRNVKFIMMYTDQRPSPSKFVKEVADEIDLLLVTNQDKYDHNLYDGLVPMVLNLYDGVCPNEYWPKPKTPKYDCFFGGNNFWRLNQELEKRKQNPAPWIKKFSGAEFRDKFLLEVNKHFRLSIRGELGWDTEIFNVKKPRFHPRYLEVLRNSKIILSTVNLPRYGLLTRRIFRSVASGRLYVTQYSPGLEDAFENHKHLVWFETVEEGVDVIDYYLRRPYEAEKIARNGRKLIIEKHTWKHRLNEFVHLLKGVFR